MILWVEASSCPNQCRNCTLGGARSAATYFTAAELRQLADEWGPLIPLSDPTVHAEFPGNLSRDFVPAGWTYLGSNGTGLSQLGEGATLMLALRESGFVGLYFAVHGLDQLHDLIVGRQGAFSEVKSASQRAAREGLYVHWQLYLNRENLCQVGELTQLALDLYGGRPELNFFHYRIHPRHVWYETLRPRLSEVQGKLPKDVVAERWPSLDSLTEAAWIEGWIGGRDVGAYRHPFEPPTWPPRDSSGLCLTINRDRQVYLEPFCAPPIHLGGIEDGRELVMARLADLGDPTPRGDWSVHLDSEGRDVLHPSGHSVRYKALSRMYNPDKVCRGSLDFCGHF